MKEKKKFFTRLLSLLMIVCIMGFIFQKSIPVQAAANISEEARAITDYEDEMKIIFGNTFTLTKIDASTYKATYSPKDGTATTKTVYFYQPKVTFSYFTSKFGFTSKLCMTEEFTVTKATKIRDTVINAFVSGFLTKGVSWVIGATVGVGTTLLDQSLPEGKYKKAVIRTEIKYPEMKGSSTYIYESFQCEYRVLKYNEYDKEWNSYIGVRGGADPMYEYNHWSSYLF